MADGVSTQTQSRTPRRPGKGHNGAPSAADVRIDAWRRIEIADELCDEMLLMFNEMRERLKDIKDPVEYVKACDTVGKQGSRLHDVLNIAAVETSIEADRINAAADRLESLKKPKSRRAARKDDIEAKLAAAATEARH